MKIREKKEVRKKSEEECLKLIAEKSKRLNEVRFASASSKVKNTKEAFNLKKDIARIKTIIKEKNDDNK